MNSANIIHQRQLLDNSCFTTCLAMLIGVPSHELIDRGIHDWYMDNSSAATEIAIMEELGIVSVPMSSITRAGYWGCLYLICTPSVNAEDGNHAIILDLTTPGKSRIWDPQMGNPGMNYFVSKDVEISSQLEPNARHLGGSWHFDHRILECPVWQQ